MKSPEAGKVEATTAWPISIFLNYVRLAKSINTQPFIPGPGQQAVAKNSNGALLITLLQLCLLRGSIQLFAKVSGTEIAVPYPLTVAAMVVLSIVNYFLVTANKRGDHFVREYRHLSPERKRSINIGSVLILALSVLSIFAI